MDKYLKIAIILSSLLAGVGIFYHYVIYLPGIERQKIEKSEREQKEAAEKAKQKQEEDVAREYEVKVRYEQCIADARRNYEANWTTACKSVAKSQSEAFLNCLNTPYMGKDFCKQTFPKRDSSPDCALPKEQAESINQTHKHAQEKCLAEARIGL